MEEGGLEEDKEDALLDLKTDGPFFSLGYKRFFFRFQFSQGLCISLKSPTGRKKNRKRRVGEEKKRSFPILLHPSPPGARSFHETEDRRHTRDECRTESVTI